MRYELTDLRVFIAIAEAKSLSVGASNVHLTAPSASYRLKNLEQALGVSLFLRTQKGMTLTPAGQTVLRYAQVILGNVEKLQGELARYTDGIQGNIRLFANSSTLSSLAPSLSRFLAAYPNVNVDLEEHLSEEIVKAVLDDVADVGLVAGPIHLRGLEHISYGKDELMLVTPPGHALAARGKVSLDEALQHDLVSIGRISSNFLYLQKLASDLGKTPRVRVHAPGFEEVMRCVREGVGIALVPRSIAVEAIAIGKVEGVALDEPWALREQRVVARSLSSLPSYTQQFIRYVTGEVERQDS